MMENEIQEQLLSYRLKHKLISADQYAFLPKNSAKTCLHRVIVEFLDAAFNVEQKAGTRFLLLDISKCFDCVDHDIFLFKSQKYGVRENMVKWFSSYLNERKQVVFS